METTQTSDGSKFLRGGIYDTQEEALLGALKSPTRENKTEGQSGTSDKTKENFVQSFFPGIQKSLQ